MNFKVISCAALSMLFITSCDTSSNNTKPDVGSGDAGWSAKRAISIQIGESLLFESDSGIWGGFGSANISGPRFYTRSDSTWDTSKIWIDVMVGTNMLRQDSNLIDLKKLSMAFVDIQLSKRTAAGDRLSYAKYTLCPESESWEACSDSQRGRIRLSENPYEGGGGMMTSYAPVDIYMQDVNLQKYEENGIQGSGSNGIPSYWPSSIIVKYAEFRRYTKPN